MGTTCKSFYFQEMGWLIRFPNEGNERRKYLYYSISFADLRNKQVRTKIVLADIVDNQMFENGFPHTIGFFKESISNEMKFPANFLEIRIIRCIEEFWKFLNDLDI